MFGNGWGLFMVFKLVFVGIFGYKLLSKEDVFGDLLGGVLGGKLLVLLK